MRLVQMTREASDQLSQAAERYQVPERLRLARESARKGARLAYRTALDHPRESAAVGIAIAAALVGTVLWTLFRDRRRRAASHRRPVARVRAGTGERRTRAKHARAAAT